MKMLMASIVLAGLASVASLGLAAEPHLVRESAAPLDGAIDGISDITTVSHLPGYGLNVNARLVRDFDLDTVVDQLQSTVLGLSGLVRGLDEGDFVSVAWYGRSFGADEVLVVVRMRPGSPETLETYIDGLLQ